jgi:hypothetical protein
MRVDRMRHARVEDQRRRLDVIHRPDVRVGVNVGVQDRVHEIAFLETEPRFGQLRAVVAEHADPVTAL